MKARNHSKKKVMVFGVFDEIHPGHVSFLQQARSLGDYLVGVVARDETVQRLKNRSPRRTLSERVESLKVFGLVDEVLIGDLEEGSWKIFDTHEPQVIALGYDQEELKGHLEELLPSLPFQCELIMLKPYQPEYYHSSIQNS